MQAVLVNLMSLQKIDSQLQELEEKRGDLPLRINQLSEELKAAENDVIEKKARIEEMQKEKGMIEIDIKTLNEKKKQYQDQLYQVKNNREYDAITLEIEAAENAINEKENRILELMDLEDTVNQSLEENEARLKEIKENYEKDQSELQKRMAETEKEETELKKQRKELIQSLPPRILNAYDRTRKAKNGHAVVELYKNACGGCYKNLPPQRVLEIKQMNKLVLCEVCGRIIVWDETASEDE